MRGFRHWPLSGKLIAMMIATTGFALLFTASAFVFHEVQQYRQTAANELVAFGRILAANSTAALLI